MGTQQLIAKKIAEIHPVADQFPGVIIIHNICENFNKVEYMSPRGLSILGITLEELKNMHTDYHSSFFNEDDAKDYVPKLLEMIKRNKEDEIYTFFQQVRASEKHPWQWHISSTKILLKDDAGVPLLAIFFAVPIDPLHHFTSKVQRLLDENNFLRSNLKTFTTLSRREKELVKHLALGHTSSEIAQKLHIAADTVKTHRKNIYKKLNINSVHELLQYARAFDLV